MSIGEERYGVRSGLVNLYLREQEPLLFLGNIRKIVPCCLKKRAKTLQTRAKITLKSSQMSKSYLRTFTFQEGVIPWEKRCKIAVL